MSSVEWSAFVAGFAASIEGWNGECPFDGNRDDIASNEAVMAAFSDHASDRTSADGGREPREDRGLIATARLDAARLKDPEFRFGLVDRGFAAYRLGRLCDLLEEAYAHRGSDASCVSPGSGT